MRKSVVLLFALSLVISLSGCHQDFAEKNPKGFIPIAILITFIIIMTGYALRLTFKKK